MTSKQKAVRQITVTEARENASGEDAIGFSLESDWLINLYDFSETIAQRTLKNEVTLDCFRYSVEYSFMNTIA